MSMLENEEAEKQKAEEHAKSHHVSG